VRVLCVGVVGVLRRPSGVGCVSEQERKSWRLLPLLPLLPLTSEAAAAAHHCVGCCCCCCLAAGLAVASCGDVDVVCWMQVQA
jgi:hypothetical protein